MNYTAPLGLMLAFATVALGFLLEGGKLAVLFQPEGLLIVLGGAMAAVMVQNSSSALMDGIRLVGWVFRKPKPLDQESLATLIAWGRKAMLEGASALETVDTRNISQFAARGLQLLAVGHPASVIEDALNRELEAYHRKLLTAARIWHQAGGYAPTFGIVGAVLGLIQVTGHIAEPMELGKGIAVAFVSTLYGVGLANMCFLPLYGRIKALIENELRYRSLYLDGILAISRKESPKTIETRLLGEIHQAPH